MAHIQYYKITSPNTDRVYVGATTRDYLPQRLCEHVYNVGKENRSRMTSEEVIRAGDAKIELIEKTEYVSKELKRKREEELIAEHNCVNKLLNKKPK